MKGLVISLVSLSILFGASGILAQKKPKPKKPKVTTTQPTSVVNPASQKEFVSTDGKFKVMFPVQPTIKTTNEGQGELRLKSVSHRAFGGTVGYAVTYTDSFYSFKPNDERNLESLKNLVTTRGKVLKETKLNLDGIQGWEIIYQKPDQSIAQHQIYSVGKRQYELMAVYGLMTGEKIENAIERNKPEVSKFLDSFKIIK